MDDNKGLIWIGFVGFMLLVVTVICVWLFDIYTVKGAEIAVRETMSGLQEKSYTSGTYFLMPTERMVSYPTSIQTFVMNDKHDHEGETAVGRSSDAYLVQSADSQDMFLSIRIQWQIDPTKVLTFHTQVGKEGDDLAVDKGLRPTVQRIVKDEATVVEAIEAYSGTGLVNLQKAIEQRLLKDEELHKKGIIVESFVIEHIRLDSEYVKEITARQVSIQKELRARQDEKTAVAEAAKAKAEAQKAYEQELVNAKTKNEVLALGVKTEQENLIAKAKAEAERTVMAANAKKESAEAEAASIEALGKANAESERLKFSAYSAPGADVYARIEVAKSMGQSLSGIRGYLPENMSVYTLGESFMSAVENVVKPKVVGQK